MDSTLETGVTSAMGFQFLPARPMVALFTEAGCSKGVRGPHAGLSRHAESRPCIW